MRPIHRNRLGMTAFIILTMVLGGCFGTSQPSRFYTLTSLKSPDSAARTAQEGPGAVLAVGPLAVPDYLDRPEVVTSTGQNEMRVNEYQRWAGTLESNLSLTLVENLSALLPADRFSVVRGEAAAQTRVPVRYRVMVDVRRFDAAPRGSAILDADWSIYGMDKETPMIRKFSVSEKVNGTEFADVVAAMSKAVEDLSGEIAKTIDALDQQAGGQ
jgi:uncharacterized lipoprotein YmbA